MATGEEAAVPLEIVGIIQKNCRNGSTCHKRRNRPAEFWNSAEDKIKQENKQTEHEIKHEKKRQKINKTVKMLKNRKMNQNNRK